MFSVYFYFLFSIYYAILYQVFCVGQAIGAVVATSEHAAKVAADLVKVTYEDLPSIITLEVGVYDFRTVI